MTHLSEESVCRIGQHVVFDLIGVLAGPSWRELCPTPDLAAWDRFKVGACGEASFWSQEAAAAYRAALGLRRDRVALLARLRAQGAAIVVASNFAAPWLATVRERVPAGLVDHWLVSGELGVAKPAAGFWAALRSVVPAGSVVVDDQRRNCEAASRHGFRGLWAPPGADPADLIDAALAVRRP